MLLWVGTAGSIVNIYDSVYDCVSSHVKDQMAAILLFSLAFAIYLANGLPPEKQVFDQAKFRIIFRTA